MPRLLTVRQLVSDPLKYGISLPAVTNSRRFADTGSQIDMALAAELAGIDKNELYQLNPGVNRWATDPDGPHRLLVPAEQAEAFQAALASLGDGERVSWTKHEVKKGETIGALADKYQTTAAVLREVNGLRGNALHAGQSLLIPAARASASEYALSADARAARAKSVTRSGRAPRARGAARRNAMVDTRATTASTCERSRARPGAQVGGKLVANLLERAYGGRL